MSEVATEQPPVQSLSKKELVLAALAAGKSSAEAAKDAGCAIQYVYGIVKKQKEEAEDDGLTQVAAPFVPARSAAVAEMAAELPTGTALEGSRVSLGIVARRIWPDVMARVAGRLRMSDDRVEIAAKDAWEAADCFLIKAREYPDAVVSDALVIWPAMWRDYAARGRVIKNFQVSAESAVMALGAAEAFLKHGSASQG